MSSSAPLVLKTFQIDYTGHSGAHILIEGRQPGIYAMILTMLGLEPISSVKVTGGAISFRSTSLSGMDQVTAALTSVGAFIGGYRKPIGYLVASVVSTIAGFVLWLSLMDIGEAAGIDSIYLFYLGMGLSLIFVIVYSISKEMYIGFETSGGAKHFMVFRRSILEGVPVDISRIEEAINLVNGLISSTGTGGRPVVETNKVQTFGRQATITSSQKTIPAVQAGGVTTQVPTVAPLTNLRGEVREDGIEWLEYPVNSDNWFFRDTTTNNWIKQT
jgi:hypothetical protein